VTSVTDFNDLIRSGFYYCGNITLNQPSSSQYWLVIVIGSGNLVRQLAFRIGTQDCYTRYRANDMIWRSWYKFNLTEV